MWGGNSSRLLYLGSESLVLWSLATARVTVRVGVTATLFELLTGAWSLTALGLGNRVEWFRLRNVTGRDRKRHHLQSANWNGT